MPFVAQPQEKCTACGRTVFATEKMTVEETGQKKIFHKTCLKCKTCSVSLSLGNYSAMNGEFFCKPHFKQLFATKGNYEEGFGNEKHTTKWEPAAVVAPTSFVPENKEERSEKTQTSDATVAKFKKFREEGESNKCESCSKTVYAAEKVLVEDKAGKRLFHKTCFKCSVCNLTVDLRNYGSKNGIIYCKNHLKEAELNELKEKTAASTGGATSNFTSSPSSFIPVEESTKKEEKVVASSSATTEKFKKFREEGDSNKCEACSKSVYAAERLLVEDKAGKRLFHKTCFKCSVCNLTVDLRNYGSKNGVIYCKNHLKEAEINELKEKTAASTGGATSNFASAPKSFVPETTEEKKVKASSETPEHIASKFKGLGVAEKCKACGKSVYATEKIVVEELNSSTIYHKQCLKCSSCGIKVDLSTFGSAGGVIYCKTHLKTEAAPEMAKVAFDPEAPLTGLKKVDAEKVSHVPVNRVSEENSDSFPNSPASNRRKDSLRSSSSSVSQQDDSHSHQEQEQERETPKEEEEEQQKEEQLKGSESPVVPHRNVQEQEEEENSREEPQETKSEPNLPSTSAPASSADDDDAERERRMEERKREREERRKQAEAEAAREEEERQKRLEERRKRLEAAKNDE